MNGLQTSIPIGMFRVCKACGYNLPEQDYFPNHWAKPDGDEFSRCKTCVKAGVFMVTDPIPEFYWVGWPKCPIQVLIERGWSPPRDATYADYSPERIGELTMLLPDHLWLLQCYEIAGHHGYGGPQEGLCCMPGCTKEDGLKVCTSCLKYRYCSVEHQRMHWRVHQHQCEADSDLDIENCDYDSDGIIFPEQLDRQFASRPAHAGMDMETRDTNIQRQPQPLPQPQPHPIPRRLPSQAQMRMQTQPPPLPQRSPQLQPPHQLQRQMLPPKNVPKKSLQEKRSLTGTGSSVKVLNEGNSNIEALKLILEPQPTDPDKSMGLVALVQPEDRELSTRFSFAVLNEFCACSFKESDRQGKRKGLRIGFPGLQCKYCRGCNRKGGRFFPSTIKTMADTKKTLISIQNHLLKCDRCPNDVKENLMRLRDCHEFERKKQKYGSQKAFFLNIWNRLHGGTDYAIKR